MINKEELFMFKGIDISKWNGNINWNEVKKDEAEFAIIREGWGKKSPTQIDKKFKENYCTLYGCGSCFCHIFAWRVQ